MVTFVPIETECSLCGTFSEQQIGKVPPQKGCPIWIHALLSQCVRALFFGCSAVQNAGTALRIFHWNTPLPARRLNSPAYQKVLRQRSLPEKGRQFLAWALIQEARRRIWWGGLGGNACRLGV